MLKPLLHSRYVAMFTYISQCTHHFQSCTSPTRNCFIVQSPLTMLTCNPPKYPSLSVLYITNKNCVVLLLYNCAFFGLRSSPCPFLAMFTCNPKHTHHFQSCTSPITNCLVLLLSLIVNSLDCAQDPYPLQLCLCATPNIPITFSPVH